MKSKTYFLLGITLILLTGYATDLTKKSSHLTESQRVQNPQFPQYRLPEIEAGSLWPEISSISLYPDRRARRVGEILTVRIVKDPEAKLTANTKTSRASSAEGKLKRLGYMLELAEKHRRLAHKPGRTI